MQTTCIAIAFTTAGFFLNTAFQDWKKEPVITTLDSIAAPISLIQFPTVTVCQEEYKPADNWAYLEKILDNVAFGEDCKRTKKVRNDFWPYK